MPVSVQVLSNIPDAAYADAPDVPDAPPRHSAPLTYVPPGAGMKRRAAHDSLPSWVPEGLRQGPVLAAVSTAVLLLLLLCCGVGCCFWRRRRQRDQERFAVRLPPRSCTLLLPRLHPEKARMLLHPPASLLAS
jgi:hypothetical protein